MFQKQRSISWIKWFNYVIHSRDAILLTLAPFHCIFMYNVQSSLHFSFVCSSTSLPWRGISLKYSWSGCAIFRKKPLCITIFDFFKHNRDYSWIIYVQSCFEMWISSCMDLPYKKGNRQFIHKHTQVHIRFVPLSSVILTHLWITDALSHLSCFPISLLKYY